MQLILGSRNAHKLRELSELLHPHQLVPLPDTIELPPETATSVPGRMRALPSHTRGGGRMPESGTYGSCGGAQQ